jgi:gamma-glutamyltranspeptidase/glutathione hydrolase
MQKMQNQSTVTNLVKTEATASNGMVATKDPEATKAGLEMLKSGGNAVDAAVAACFAVGVVEPASSGIGGGGYLVYQMGQAGGVIGFPMRGPLSATPDMFQLTGEGAVGNFGWPAVKNNENIEGYRSIATPGAVAGLCEAHSRFGKLPLKDVLAPAVRLAREGFAPGWHSLYAMGTLAGMLFKYEELRRVLMPGGNMPLGDLSNPANLKQPELANILEAIGREGPDAYYKGDFAKTMTADIQANGGSLSMDDLAQYKPFVWDKGLEFSYRGYTVRVPPFASAGITSAMTLKLLDGFDLASMGHNSEEMLHTYITCARLAYADRFEYVADPEFAEVPWNGLVSDEYIARRRGEVAAHAASQFLPGDPWVEEGRRPEKVLASSRPGFDNGTTHLCVIDGDGNAVSMTNTIMSGFGSGIIPKGTGVVMNNGMMWYDPEPGRVNSIAPGKFPLNNMTPALVMDSDGVKLAVGASGGRRITNCVTQQIIKILDFGMGPQAAIDSPRLDCSMPFTSVDPRYDAALLSALEGRGHTPRVIGGGQVEAGFASFASPVAILRGEDGLTAGVDSFHSAYAEGI